MEIELKNPKTGEIRIVQSAMDVSKIIENINKPNMSKQDVHNFLEKIELKADVKGILTSIHDVTIKIGNTAVNIGKKILELIYYFVKKYPNTSIGVVVGSVLGILISSIPIIGFVLSWLITPLCIALGLGIGFWEDMVDRQLYSAIDLAKAEVFGNLSNVKI